MAVTSAVSYSSVAEEETKEIVVKTMLSCTVRQAWQKQMAVAATTSFAVRMMVSVMGVESSIMSS